MKIFPRMKKNGSSPTLRRGKGSTKRLDRSRKSGGGSGSSRRHTTFDAPSRRLIAPVRLIESDVSDTTSNASPPVTPDSGYKHNMNSHVEGYSPSVTTTPRIARSPIQRTMSMSYTPKKKQSAIQHIVGRMRSFKDSKSLSSGKSERSGGFFSTRYDPRPDMSITVDESPLPETPPPRKQLYRDDDKSIERYAVEDASTIAKSMMTGGDVSSVTDTIYGNASPHPLQLQLQAPPPILLNAPSDEDSVFDDMSFYTSSTGFTGGTSEFPSTLTGGTGSTGTSSAEDDTIGTGTISGYEDSPSVYSTGASGASLSSHTNNTFDVMQTIREDMSQKKKISRSKQKVEKNTSFLGTFASDAEAFMNDVAAVGVVCGACHDDFSFEEDWDDDDEEEEEEPERYRPRRSKKEKSKRRHRRK